MALIYEPKFPGEAKKNPDIPVIPATMAHAYTRRFSHYCIYVHSSALILLRNSLQNLCNSASEFTTRTRFSRERALSDPSIRTRCTWYVPKK